MKLSRITVLVSVVLAVGVALAGWGFASAGTTPAAQTTDDPSVVSYEGLSDIGFGDQRGELERDRGLSQRPGDCAPRLAEHPQVSPVFADDQLVLLWAYPPLHTPEGVGVGSSLAEVEAAYPEAEELRAMARTYQFDGLLAGSGEHAYLFLHDGDTVQKLIVGYEQYARSLFHDGFGTC